MKNNELRHFFPMLRTRQEIMKRIKSKKGLSTLFNSWEEYQQQEFLDICSGSKGINMLQNFIFISLDVFLEKLHNDGVNNELDAWLTFLGCDEPEYIIELIQKYPYFKAMYDDIYEMCRNIEGVMDMFSKELQILDRNTVKYMIDELQEDLDEAHTLLDEAHSQIADKDAIILSLQARIKELESKTK